MGRSRDKGDKPRTWKNGEPFEDPYAKHGWKRKRKADPATRQERAAGLRAIAAREFQHCDDIDAQIQCIEIEIQRLAGERDAHDARARRAVGDAARLEGR